MLKIMIRKQMAEVFRTCFYDAKKNKARSKGKVIALLILYAVVLAGALGGVFTWLSLALSPLFAAGMQWLYFVIMSGIALALGSFGSIFSTYSSLYLAKDNDLLFAMPIPVRDILFARLFSVYILGAMYLATAAIPAAVVYFVKDGFSGTKLFGCIVWFLVLTILTLTISCLLGFIVARVSVKLKHRKISTAVISVLFIGIYYFVYFRASEMIGSLLKNAAKIGGDLRHISVLYAFGKMPTGDVPLILLFAGISAALLTLILFVMTRSFLKIATATGNVTRVAYREATAKQKGMLAACFGKELARFTGSTTYMLNCGIGIPFAFFAGAALLIKGPSFWSTIDYFNTELPGMPVVIACVIPCFFLAMIDITAPSVALEGKNLWIARSLPIPTATILQAKVCLQVVLSIVPSVFCSICSCIVFKLGPLECLFAILIPLEFCVIVALFGLFLGMRKPNLNWTNEVYPIKQSLSVLFTLLAGILYTIIFFGAFIVVAVMDEAQSGRNSLLYLTVFVVINLLLILLLNLWLRKKASKKFEAL
ncbi:MAG: hypothetical protein UHN88_07945 [Eubacterium sp.]|nr:hypothetical protein [Eubacterium sp.]